MHKHFIGSDILNIKVLEKSPYWVKEEWLQNLTYAH